MTPPFPASGAAEPRGSETGARRALWNTLRLLPDADLASALLSAERIRAAVATLSLHAGTPSAPEAMRALRVTITVGVAPVTPTSRFDQAIARADAALYRGKAAGRDRVVADVAWTVLPAT